jgi:hypothetical protein
MADEGDKGFRVIDRRGREEEPPTPAPGETPLPPVAEGNPPPAPGVQGEKGRGEGPPRVGAPRFLDLVQSIQLGAMVSLGMVQGPDGKRPPADLPAAKDAIDILGILQEKTKGNLAKEEEEVLREGLYHLRMGYVALLSAPPGGENKGGNKR